MNRKNLTAAVLAGLAGAAGIAGTAQAVNINPDGTGQVLLYPYYTTNDGNQTVISVVNTTENAKAVKVRFLEGFNSREVLDFNLYMSREDVWVAALVNGEDFTGDSSLADSSWLLIPDTSCTVPYLYETNQIELANGEKAGLQRLLTLAFADKANDGGPEGEARTAEGHIEMIEMGTIDGSTQIQTGVDSKGNAVYYNLEKAITHKNGVPQNCDLLTDLWTEYYNQPSKTGLWVKETECGTGCTQPATTGTTRNSGGLFGGGAVINVANGTMFSYDAKAIQGFDSMANGIHYRPGTIYPSLDSGSEDTAYVFFGVPQNMAVPVDYVNGDGFTVDAVSAVFMHDFLMNEYVVDPEIGAGTEWVITFPTKNFYVDPDRMRLEGFIGPAPKEPASSVPPGYTCTEIKTGTNAGKYEDCEALPRDPFTELFGATDSKGNQLCEVVSIQTWDREEATYIPDDPTSPVIPPVVSPSVPPTFGCEDLGNCESIFQLCYEVNVLRFGENSVFGTPEIEGQTLLHTVSDEFTEGWGRIDFTNSLYGQRTDSQGMVGLPVTGFAAYEFENDFLTGGVKANYGGLFGHKFSVRKVSRMEY